MAKILLVEDDKFLRTILERKLKQNNFEVITAVNGQEAIDQAIKSLPDLIILDIILPEESGFEVLENFQKDPNLAKIPVFILSNLGQPEDIQKGKEFGVIDYFVKAKTSLDEFVQKIKEFLETKKQ